MKKIMNVFIALILLSSTIPLTFADESENSSFDVKIDQQTQIQTEIMKDGLGAEIRLLQLEKAILKNIDMGKEIISFINESNVNITALQVILAEFELLAKEFQNADPNATTAVNLFVDLKHDAVNLTKEFRETLREMTNSTTTALLQQQLRNVTCNHTNNLSKNIQNKIRQYNGNQIRKMYQFFGENVSDYVNKYQNGTITLNQFTQNITKKIDQQGKQRQINLLSSLKKQKIQRKIHSQYNIQNASEGFHKRQQDRLSARLNQSENLSDNPFQQALMKRIQNKLNNLNDSNNNDNNGGKGKQGNDGNGESDNGTSSSGQDNDNSGQDIPGEGGDNASDGSNKPGGGGGV